MALCSRESRINTYLRIQLNTLRTSSFSSTRWCVAPVKYCQAAWTAALQPHFLSNPSCCGLRWFLRPWAIGFSPTFVAKRRRVFLIASCLIHPPCLFRAQRFALQKVSFVCSGTLPNNTRLTNTAKVSKSRFPVSPTELPTSCLRWPGRRPSGPAAESGLKVFIALLISFLEAVLGWCILSSGGRGRLRSVSTGGCFSCKTVKV